MMSFNPQALRINHGVFAALCLTLLGACDDPAPTEAVTPVMLTREHRGHYCRMIVLDHKGPKGQIHLKNRGPVFFSSVRDTIAFTMLPEESRQIAAIFVNDMTATDWNRPGPETWIPARRAYFVIGSSKRGGMGAPEAVPFKGEAAALAFVSRFGGRVVAFGAIPRQYILGESPHDQSGHGAHHTGSKGDGLKENHD